MTFKSQRGFHYKTERGTVQYIAEHGLEPKNPTAPIRQKIELGDITVVNPGVMGKGKVWIEMPDGEGGDFDEAGLVAAIKNFYKEHF